MGLRCEHVTFDCAEPKVVAGFWAAIAGSEVPGGEDFIVIDGSSIGLDGLAFAKVPEGKSTKNRVHLDLVADDRQAEVERAIELGATLIADRTSGETSWSVLADPEGNEFCIV